MGAPPHGLEADLCDAVCAPGKLLGARKCRSTDTEKGFLVVRGWGKGWGADR